MEGGDAAEQTSNSAASIEESPADENTPLNGKRLSQTGVAFCLVQFSVT